MLLRLLSCALLSLLISQWATADIYKTVDKNGKVIYSDKPSGDAPSEPINLPPVNTVPAEQPSYSPPPPTFEQPPLDHYQIEIISPHDNMTVTAGQRDLGIAVSLDHSLAPDDLLLYFMNGELLEETKNTSIFIQNIIRGAHTIQVEAIAKDGTSLGKSPSITVNVIRPSVLGPNAVKPAK